MSDTTVDMAKVTQMLDSEWTVTLFKSSMGTYEVRAKHYKSEVMDRVRNKIAESIPQETMDMLRRTALEITDDFSFDGGWLMSEDFTPQQALTRMAYKVFGEIL